MVAFDPLLGSTTGAGEVPTVGNAEHRVASGARAAEVRADRSVPERTFHLHDNTVAPGLVTPSSLTCPPPGGSSHSSTRSLPHLGGLRGVLATAAGRAGAVLSRRLGLGEGAVIGGRVTRALEPGALARLSTGRRVVLVTGTNGKTTTAHLLAAALRSRSRVAHNDGGANMADGALAALLADPSAPVAVLEVDELHLAEVSAATAPEVVVLLNLTRDQLDRSTEVTAVAACIRAALQRLTGVRVVANGDDPVVTATVAGLPDVRWFAGGCAWTQDSALCPRCGSLLSRGGADWCCRVCDLHRPTPDWRLSGSVAEGPEGLATPLSVALPGGYNLRNALAAVAAAAALGVEPEHAAAAVAQVRSVDHRYAVVDHGRHRLTLLLAKNPAGWRETLPIAARFPALLVVINAREADGRDTSWLWDVPCEDLAPVAVVACGESAADLGLRLTYAGVAHRTHSDALEALSWLPSGDVGVIANYTAFRELWHRLDRSP